MMPVQPQALPISLVHVSPGSAGWVILAGSIDSDIHRR